MKLEGITLSLFSTSSSGIMDVHYEDKLAGVLPFFHIYGQVGTMVFGLMKGCTICTFTKFDFMKFLQTIQDEKVRSAAA